MLDDEMIAHAVEWILVQTGGVGLFQTLVKLEVEDLKAQGLRGPDFLPAARQACRVLGGRTNK